MKNKILASIVAAPFAASAVFAHADVASAAALTGRFSFDGSDSNPATTVILSNNGFDFTPDDAKIDIKLATESFTAFNDAYIYDLVDPVNSTPSLFMDFGAEDGQDILYATSLGEYQYSDLGFGVTGINVGFEGFFESSTGDRSQAVGGITLQTVGSIAQAKNDVANGNLEATFSGVTIASTPEPTTLLGLGVIATGLVASRRKKNS